MIPFHFNTYKGFNPKEAPKFLYKLRMLEVLITLKLKKLRVNFRSAFQNKKETPWHVLNKDWRCVTHETSFLTQ